MLLNHEAVAQLDRASDCGSEGRTFKSCQLQLNKISAHLKNLLSDKITGTWQLLSQTEYFLSQAGLHPEYESQMRDLRARLNSGNKSGKEKIIKEVHLQLVELRKELRQLGYDVSLGKYRLIFDGFRHDDSIRDGFRRVVLYFLDEYFLWQTGDANHIELAEILNQQITRHTQATGNKINIRGKHYLWYLRTKNELILSGADTETKDGYERLKAYGEASGLLFLSRLKDLK